jgi:cation:H+ antiporter
VADRTGLGEALVGSVLLGASTSLPGITTSVTAAWAGEAELAKSNAIGGIAAQTAFLSIADFFNRRANLEHAAASLPNILLGGLLIGLLALVLLAADGPAVAIYGVHPATPLLLIAYLGGLHLARRTRNDPQWWPRRTALTRVDVPEPPEKGEAGAVGLTVRFLVAALLTAGAGWLVARAGIGLAEQTGLSRSVVGGLFTALSTSLPELVTAIAAVRAGALTLAVGNILGGNAFDVLFAAAADVAYREGSIYHAIGAPERFMVGLAILLAATLVVGLIQREKRGVANIGFESMLILLLYLTGFLIVSLAMTG